MATKSSAPTRVKPKGDKSKSTIRQVFNDKRESLIREGQVTAMILQNVLGLDPDGDMKDFVRTVKQSLRERKKT